MKAIGWVPVAIVLIAGSAWAKPARPDAVLAVASRSAPSALDGVRAFANAIAPNTMQAPDDVVLAGLADAIGATHLDGLDRAKAIYVLYVDDGSTKGLAVVAHVSDGKALAAGIGTAQSSIRDSWAALGSKEVLALVGDYALSTVATTPAPKGLTATIYIGAVLDRYKGQIALARLAMTQVPGGAQMTQLMATYFDGLMSVAQDASEVRVVIDASAERASVDSAFVPKPGSRLAKFVALQQPSDFGLLAKLPETAPMLFAGRAALGPYRQGFMDVMGQMYGATSGADLIAVFDALMQATSGEIAMSFGVAGGMSVTQLFGISDTHGADAAVTSLLKLLAPGRVLEMSGMKATYSISPDVTGHDGVTLHPIEGKIDTSKVPVASKAALDKVMPTGVIDMDLAMFDKLGVITVGGDPTARANRAIDAIHGKGKRFTPPADITKLVDASRKRKDSIVMVMDMFALIGKPSPSASGIVMSFGFADKAAHMRFEMPVAVAHGFAP